MEKTLKERVRNVSREFLYFLIPFSSAIVFLFWKIDLLTDLNHNTANLWYFNSLAIKAHSLGVPVTSLLSKVYASWSDIPGYFFQGLFEWYVFGVPLAQAWFLVSSRFIDPAMNIPVLTSSLIGLLVIIATYITARLFYNIRASIFAALYLSASLPFILTIRSGYVFYAFDSLCGIFVILLSYLAHKHQKRFYLYLLSAAFSLGWFNGYSMFLIVIPAILTVFILLSRYWWHTFTFAFTEYAKAFLLALILCLSYFIIYSMYLNVSPLSSFIETHHYFFWRSGTVSTPLFDIKLLLDNLKRGILILFYKSYLPPSTIAAADNVAPYGHAAFPPMISFFLFYGIYTLFQQRTLAGRLLLTTVGISSFFVFMMLPFDTRYLMTTLPAFYLIAGFGTQQFMETVQARCKSAFIRRGTFIFIIFSVIGTLYVSYNFYFNTYVSHDSYLGRFYGQVQAGRYVAQHYNDEETVVVLGDKFTVPEDIFTFATLPKSFDYIFWENIRENLSDFEETMFMNKNKIVFIFSNGHNFLDMPGNRYADPVDWEAFEDIHPDISPRNIVLSQRGWPVMSIYELQRNNKRSKVIQLNKINTFKSEILDRSQAEISAVKLAGGMNSPDIIINRNSLRVQCNLLPSMDMLLLPHRPGRLRFIPYFLENDSYKQDIYEMHNVQLSQEDPRFLELDSPGEGYVLYKIDSPTKILSLSIEARPRLYNDRRKRNSITAMYSYDDKEYVQLFRVTSNGSHTWDLHFHRDTYHIIRPNAKTVYIKFLFTGQKAETQLWSPPPVGALGKLYAMKFIADIEPLEWNGFQLLTSYNRLRLHQGTNDITGVVSVYFKDIK